MKETQNTEIYLGKGRKHSGEKEKILATSIFSFFHTDLQRLLSHGHENTFSSIVVKGEDA